MKALVHAFQERHKFKFKLEVVRGLNLREHVSDAARVSFKRKLRQFLTDFAMVDETGTAVWEQGFLIECSLFCSKEKRLWDSKTFCVSIKSNLDTHELGCTLDFAHYATLKVGQYVSATLALSRGRVSRDTSPSLREASTTSSTKRREVMSAKSASTAPGTGPQLVLRITRMDEHDVGSELGYVLVKEAASSDSHRTRELAASFAVSTGVSSAVPHHSSPLILTPVTEDRISSGAPAFDKGIEKSRSGVSRYASDSLSADVVPKYGAVDAVITIFAKSRLSDASDGSDDEPMKRLKTAEEISVSK